MIAGGPWPSATHSESTAETTLPATSTLEDLLDHISALTVHGFVLAVLTPCWNSLEVTYTCDQN